jgi:hypothetical protein
MGRTLAWLRSLGYEVQVVEKRVPHTWVTQDLFGCIDILALVGPEIANVRPGVLGVQATTGPHHTARIAKAQAEPRLVRWLQCGGQFAVVSWTKGKRLDKWLPRVSVAHLAGTTIKFTED